MSKKLLKKTTRQFVTFSVVVFILAAPLFYFMSHWLYTYETDELLLVHRDEFLDRFKQGFSQNDRESWNKYNVYSTILEDRNLTGDSIVNEVVYDTTAREQIPFRVLYSPIEIEGEKFTYTERMNLVEMEAMVLSIGLMFTLVIAVFLLGVVWISKKNAQVLWLPFYHTLNQIRDFEMDKHKLPIFLKSDITEFISLNKSIEKLIDRNLDIYKTQREFVENAAHELQTPLALFQTKIDSLMQTSGLSKAQSILLHAINEDVSRLNRLNKNLLLLSRIENDDFAETRLFYIADYKENNFEFFEEQAAAKKIEITWNKEANLSVDTNPFLLEVLLNNLFINAIKHNVSQGHVQIDVKKSALVFSNTAAEGKLEIEPLFNRFSKANQAAKGNGLGLAIVKKILEMNRWKLIYSFKDHRHYFEIQF